MSPHPTTQVPGLVTKRSPSPDTHSFARSLRKRFVVAARRRRKGESERQAPPAWGTDQHSRRQAKAARQVLPEPS